MTMFEIWLYGMGYISVFALVLAVLGAVADALSGVCDSIGDIPRVLMGAVCKTFRSIGDWLFDVQTAYYKHKAHRARKKNKQCF